MAQLISAGAALHHAPTSTAILMISRRAAMSIMVLILFTGPLFAKLDHFKILLARAAIRTLPVFRHIRPASARRYAIVRPTFLLIVNETAYQTLPPFHNTSRYYVES